MTERFARAMSACRGFALPFGIFWALLMAVLVAFSVARNPAQTFYWGNIVVVAVIVYVLILGVVFLDEFLSSRRN